MSNQTITNPRDTVTGVILAGGEGHRMGGLDKGLVELQNRPLVEHVIDRLLPQVGQIMISANRNISTYSEYGYPVIQDTHTERFGPLAGILAAMQAADTPFIVTVPCDAPALPVNLVERLVSAWNRENPDICVVSLGGRFEPVFQLTSSSLADKLQAYLDQGERRAMRWIKQQHCVVVEFNDANAFTNINTRDELDAQEKC